MHNAGVYVMLLLGSFIRPDCTSCVVGQLTSVTVSSATSVTMTTATETRTASELVNRQLRRLAPVLELPCYNLNSSIPPHPLKDPSTTSPQ